MCGTLIISNWISAKVNYLSSPTSSSNPHCFQGYQRSFAPGLRSITSAWQIITISQSGLQSCQPCLSEFYFLLRRNWLAWYECLITLTSSSRWPPVSTQGPSMHIVKGWFTNAQRLTSTCQYTQKYFLSGRIPRYQPRGDLQPWLPEAWRRKVQRDWQDTSPVVETVLRTGIVYRRRMPKTNSS